MPKLKPMFEQLLRRDAAAGQAIVLVALFMLVLVGMLGLAIDGGGLFLLYRDARNAADTAALQAAYARCTSPEGSNEYKTTGLDAADENGFRNGNISLVEVKDYGDVTGDSANDGKVYVSIVSTKPTYFAQVVFSGPLTIQVESVAFCDRGINPDTNPGARARADSTVCGFTGANTEFNWSGANAYFNGNLETGGSLAIQAQTRFEEGSTISYYGVLKGDGRTVIGESGTDSQNNVAMVVGKSAPWLAANNATSVDTPNEGDLIDLDPNNNEPAPPAGDLIDFDDWQPGGVLYDYIANNGGKVYFVNGDFTPNNLGEVPAAIKSTYTFNRIKQTGGTAGAPETVTKTWIEGLIVATGDIKLGTSLTGNALPALIDTHFYTVDKDWNYTDFVDAYSGGALAAGTYTIPGIGSKTYTAGQIYDATWQGVTMISISGTIDVAASESYVRYYRGLDGFTGASGLADEIATQTDYPGIIMASLQQNLDCNASTKSLAFGNKTNAYGVMYAPQGAINISFADAYFRGAMDAWTINYAGSDSYWWYDPTLLVSRGPSTGQQS